MRLMGRREYVTRPLIVTIPTGIAAQRAGAPPVDGWHR
jgi:hypothetical protein